MAAQKPGIPKGTRDFSQAETARRNYIFDTCRDVFRLFGYAPIETPAMENLSTLMGKYGEEGDKLLFKIQNSGEQAAAPPEKGLRYDLTVPFARYVVQHQNDIAFPFKRYQMQPVWRADRPQKGRYREFYQCDVDVIGSRSLVNELELTQIVEAVFGRLGVGVVLKLNNRKILAGIAETIGEADRLVDITVAIDKLEKIGLEAVKAELSEKGLAAESIARLEPILSLSGSNSEKLQKLAAALAGSEIGLLGIEEMSFIFRMMSELGVGLNVELDLSLARGLNYYTGTIFEVKALDWPIGSICGGGRYDDLTGIFGMPGVSGVGISFGADRIYDVMEGLGLFPQEAVAGTRVLFLNFGGAEELKSLELLSEMRRKNIAAEIYPDATKMKKQMEWANRRDIPFVVIVGEEELAKGVATLKNMRSGEQQQVEFSTLANILL
jgi:histidyl-tRNA synthetase